MDHEKKIDPDLRDFIEGKKTFDELAKSSNPPVHKISEDLWVTAVFVDSQIVYRALSLKPMQTPTKDASIFFNGIFYRVDRTRVRIMSSPLKPERFLTEISVYATELG